MVLDVGFSTKMFIEKIMIFYSHFSKQTLEFRFVNAEMLSDLSQLCLVLALQPEVLQHSRAGADAPGLAGSEERLQFPLTVISPHYPGLDPPARQHVVLLAVLVDGIFQNFPYYWM